MRLKWLLMGGQMLAAERKERIFDDSLALLGLSLYYVNASDILFSKLSPGSNSLFLAIHDDFAVIKPEHKG
ncbi:unnamed protein product [Hermetia illucens]|uniref:Uncharacterized protein n=1 Tax=Hermetia illucens TaxID=343691 RepID=A0A7R8UGT5_HERIL|nr:unnamed protein product [Hermetia illucens]